MWAVEQSHKWNVQPTTTVEEWKLLGCEIEGETKSTPDLVKQCRENETNARKSAKIARIRCVNVWVIVRTRPGA